MAELEATRANDARVAQAMGLTVVCMDWPCGREPECGCYEAAIEDPSDCGWHNERGPVVARAADGWPPTKEVWDGVEHHTALVEPVEHYLTDEAMVVPMLRRLGELAGTMPHLGGGDAWEWYCIVGREPIKASTPNLAVAGALLATYEEVQRERT